jgi:hypothetical protein
LLPSRGLKMADAMGVYRYLRGETSYKPTSGP